MSLAIIGHTAAAAGQVADTMRVVTLVPAATSILHALGRATSVVGRSHEDRTVGVEAAVDVGRVLAPDVERIHALDPHVVIVGVGADRLRRLRGLDRGSVALVALDLRRLAGVGRAVRDVGRAVDEEPKAESLADSIDGRLAAIADQHAGPGRTVLWVVGDAPVVAAGRNTFLGDLLGVVGAVNVMEGGTAWPRPSSEELLVHDPDLILWSAPGSSVTSRRPPWSALPAVREGRVVVLPPDRWLKAGPDVVGLAEDLARIIHGAAAPTAVAPTGAPTS